MHADPDIPILDCNGPEMPHKRPACAYCGRNFSVLLREPTFCDACNRDWGEFEPEPPAPHPDAFSIYDDDGECMPVRAPVALRHTPDRVVERLAAASGDCQG